MDGGWPLFLTLLFIGSTRLTEEITRSKYPEYVDYCRVTSMWVPWPSKGMQKATPA